MAQTLDINNCDTWISRHDVAVAPGAVPPYRYRKSRKLLIEYALDELATGTPRDELCAAVRKRAVKELGGNVSLVILVLSVASRIVQLVLIWMEQQGD